MNTQEPTPNAAGGASALTDGLGGIAQEKDMAELHPELAKATATTALQFLARFANEDFGIMREDSPGPHDRRHLAMALDYIQELGAMVLNLADRVPPNAKLTGSAASCAVRVE